MGRGTEQSSGLRVFRYRVVFVPLIKTEAEVALPYLDVQCHFAGGVDCATAGDVWGVGSHKGCSLIKTPA